MSKRLPLTHLLGIIFALAALAAGTWFYTNANDPVEGIPEPPPVAEEGPADQQACELAGGVWNECASACPPDAEACILMCVQKCEGIGEGEKVVAAYFPNSKLDPQHLDCATVFPVKRAIMTVGSPGAHEYGPLLRLLAGPTEEEKAAGYFTSIPEDVSIVRLSNSGKRFEVDFSAELAKVAGSCRVLSIRSQIETTIRKEFPETEEIVITIDGGDPDEALQP